MGFPAIRRSECCPSTVLDPISLEKAGIDAPYSRVFRRRGTWAGVIVIDGDSRVNDHLRTDSTYLVQN